MPRKWKSDSVVDYSFDIEHNPDPKLPIRKRTSWKLAITVAVLLGGLLFILMFSMGDQAIEQCLKDFEIYNCLN